MKIRKINSINYVEAEPAQYAKTFWPLTCPIVLDLFLGIATQSHLSMLLMMAVHLFSAAMGLLWFNSATQKSLTIYARPGKRETKKAA